MHFTQEVRERLGEYQWLCMCMYIHVYLLQGYHFTFYRTVMMRMYMEMLLGDSHCHQPALLQLTLVHLQSSQSNHQLALIQLVLIQPLPMLMIILQLFSQYHESMMMMTSS